jgi:hypothetical protein
MYTRVSSSGALKSSGLRVGPIPCRG